MGHQTGQDTSISVTLEEKLSGKDGQQCLSAEDVMSVFSDSDKENEISIANSEECVEQICFFCHKSQKVFKYQKCTLRSTESEKLQKQIFASAYDSNRNQTIQHKLDALKGSRTIYYHSICKNNYFPRRNNNLISAD